ncbi:hypothetical protein F511_29740 [Dorcoceras hygrometricum]|uniref:Uncharacterized protein n=1 Tax=Dorcoceras hygrometricum TaxID=472368 RepID=A0A2Z7CKB7_9LAMI|nr:hypothetical protein F511_29740 [Dorcoceras hygrometricum]
MCPKVATIVEQVLARRGETSLEPEKQPRHRDPYDALVIRAMIANYDVAAFSSARVLSEFIIHGIHGKNRLGDYPIKSMKIPMLEFIRNSLERVASALHQKIKYPITNGVGEVLGDRRMAQKCYVEEVRIEKKGKKASHLQPGLISGYPSLREILLSDHPFLHPLRKKRSLNYVLIRLLYACFGDCMSSSAERERTVASSRSTQRSSWSSTDQIVADELKHLRVIQRRTKQLRVVQRRTKLLRARYRRNETNQSKTMNKRNNSELYREERTSSELYKEERSSSELYKEERSRLEQNRASLN